MRFPLAPALGALLLAAALAGCGSDARRAADSFAADSIRDAFLRSSAALLHPGATRAVLVTPGGHLYTGEWVTHAGIQVDGVQVAAPAAIAYEDRWLPIVRWTRTHGPMRFEFEAVALPAPEPAWRAMRRPLEEMANARLDERARRERRAMLAGYSQSHVDSLVVRAARSHAARSTERVGLFVSLEVRVTNAGRLARRASLAMGLHHADSTLPFVAADATGPAPPRGWGDGHDTADSVHVLGWAEEPAHDTTWSAEWTASPGRTRLFRFVIPAYATPSGTLARWAQIPHERRVEEARAFWTAEVARGARIDLGDPELERAIRGARVVLLGCRERRDGRWVPLGGPFHYRDVWLRDGARALQALTLHGYVREAREMVAAFEEWQWPHGPFVSQKAQLDGTGQALWAYEQVLLRPRPDRTVRRFAESAERAWEWCERQRAASRGAAGASPAAGIPADASPAASAPSREVTPVPGMLPVADPRDNELVRAQLVGTDAWTIAGYRSTARLLRAAGSSAAARRVDASLERYAADFAAQLDRTGHADVPPSWQSIGLDWGNLAVGYPCQALPAGHPRLVALARRYWAAAGGAGLGFYGTPQLLHGYVAADLGTWALMVGRRAEFDSVLAALVRWRNASGGAAEAFTRERGDYGLNLPPHATSAAALLALARHALVFDDADTLLLTAGAREAWWQHGRAHDLPTRWGALDLEFRRRGDQAEWRWTAVPVWTALSLPPGTRVRGTLPRPLRAGARPDLVLAPPGTARARVALAEDRAAASSAVTAPPRLALSALSAEPHAGDRP